MPKCRFSRLILLLWHRYCESPPSEILVFIHCTTRWQPGASIMLDRAATAFKFTVSKLMHHYFSLMPENTYGSPEIPTIGKP